MRMPIVSCAKCADAENVPQIKSQKKEMLQYHTILYGEC